MGIPGLYKEIGDGRRVALAKLAHDHYERYARKFRLAIDASIWLFEVKSGRGGSNPELRTLYYRLLRLLRLGIDPVFVFDGPDRPAEKRNKKITGSWESPQAAQARTLLSLFGFESHLAPGEAEAECALLQTRGIVDAVFSEDVDTLMFGATLTLRNWSKQNDRTRSHVSAFYAADIKCKTSLDRQGMILVALMSGADYDTSGLARCGTKVAYEAAKAGFGHDLCGLDPNDLTGLAQWQERLQYELHSNESGFFRTKHPIIKIPPSFPNKLILTDYMHPLVSADASLEGLKSRLKEPREPDIFALRIYVAETFAWDTLAGAKKYIRGLAPAILTHRLLEKERCSSGLEGLKGVCGSRAHHTSDGILEARVEILPIALVPLDLESEPETRPNTEEQPTLEVSESEGSDLEGVPASTQVDRERPGSPIKKRGPSRYDPCEPERFYVAEFYVRLGAPGKVEAWEYATQLPKRASPKKARSTKPIAKNGRSNGLIDSYFAVKKPNLSQKDLSLERTPLAKSRPVLISRSEPTMVEREATIPKSPLASPGKRKENTPTWAGQQYYDYIEGQRKKHSTETGGMSAVRRDSCIPLMSQDNTTKVQREVIASASTMLAQPKVQPQVEADLIEPFSSPISSRELFEITQNTIQFEKNKASLSSNVRVRGSLPGSWTSALPHCERPGTKLDNVEIVDLS